MANRFLAPAEVDQQSIASGGGIEVTLRYSYDPIDASEPVPELEISASLGFQVSVEEAVRLEPATDGTVKFQLKIERGGALSRTCTLTFKALNDRRSLGVVIT